MKILIAVTTCHMFRERANACRRTWVKDANNVEVKFFLGHKDGYTPLADEVMLDCPDSYHYLTKKTQLLRKWALDNGFDYVWKVDDDAYIRPERLIPLSGPDYIGRLRGPSGLYPSPYCSGFCYGLSRRSLEILAGCEWKESDDICEDRWTANRLLPAGVSPTLEPWLIVTHSKKSALNGREAPRQDNKVVASCEYEPEHMDRIHQDFLAGTPSQTKRTVKPSGSLSRVAVMIKTFLRDGYLLACLQGIEATMPDATTVVVDDGRESRLKITKYAAMRERGDLAIWMPFDSGFGEKANVAVAHILKHCPQSEYVLVASDDFEFTPQVRTSVENMQTVLDRNPEIAVASGRVNSKSYEFSWDVLDGGSTLKEVPMYRGGGFVDGVRFHLCDLTVNFSLIRLSVLRDIKWDGGDVKIGGGEHAAFFLDLKRERHLTAYVEGADIREFKCNPQWMEGDYPRMRARARKPGRPCLKKRGIDKYILANGTEELS